MTGSTLLGRVLARFADVGLIGIAVALGSMPVFTALPALVAGAEALGEADPGVAVRKFWIEIRRGVMTAWTASVTLVVVAASAVTGLLYLAPASGAAAVPLGALFGAAGLVLAGLTPYLAIASTTGLHRTSMVRGALALAAVAPQGAVAGVGCFALGLIALSVFPIAAFPVAGLMALAVRRIGSEVERRVLPVA